MIKNIKNDTFCQHAVAAIQVELKAVKALLERIDESFTEACHCILNCPERVVVMGVGKSRYIGGKIASTLASTGTPAFFVHPGEASHGDFGMITSKDVIIAISNSGETPEILTILPLIKHLKAPLIAMTGNKGSTLALAASVHLDVSVEEEACPLQLAPTSSSTAALVMGDALAVALLQARGFTAADFAFSHPGGRLGKRLLLSVGDLMRTGKALPIIDETAVLAEALMEMSKKNLGLAIVVNAKGILSGVYTDGDLRRTLDKGLDIRATPISEAMTLKPKWVDPKMLAAEALQKMEDYRITNLAVVDEVGRPIGVLHLHDVLRAGVA